MKLSTLILELQKLAEDKGDLDVFAEIEQGGHWGEAIATRYDESVNVAVVTLSI